MNFKYGEDILAFGSSISNGALPKLSIIITNDYEIMGDGRGDVDKILIQPTEEILALCNKYRVPHTMFVDVLEYLKFVEAEEKGWLSPTYKAGLKVRTQLRNAVADGHDVQLHIHPQWLDAEPVQDDYWRVNFKYWRLSNVPSLGAIDNPVSLRGLIALGKQTLETLIQSVKPNYTCLAFRAGAYCIQPEEDVLALLREQSFLIDSSVSVGQALKQEHTRFDFRNAPKNLPYWRISHSVTEVAENGRLLEIPIFTHKVNPSFARSAPKRSNMVFNSVMGLTHRRSSLYSRVISYCLRQRLNYDFCKLTAKELIRFTEVARKRFGLNFSLHSSCPVRKTIPVVMTGHSKEWAGPRELETFLSWATGIDWIEFSTFPGWLASEVM